MSVKTDTGMARSHGTRLGAAACALSAVVLVTTILKFTAYARQPLGIDEVWTGMIAGQSSLSGLIRQCEIEVNGPLSYVLAWLWAPVGGLSDSGLRLPSALFACATPLLALAPRRLAPVMVRVVWAVLLACWLPGFAFAQLARCYALVVLLATANTVAFASLLYRPSLGRAALWSLLGALLILDHYFAAVLIGGQAIALLALRRGQALRTWPAALIFIPALADPLIKAGLLAHFAKPGVSWIGQLTLADLPNLLAFLAGSPILAAVIGGGVAFAWILERRAPARAKETGSTPGARALMIASVVAVIAALASIGLGFVFPILTARYLAAEVPGVMLAVALLAHRFSRAWPLLPALIMASAVSVVIGLAAHTGFVSQPAVTAFSFERAAGALMADHPRRLVFFWDNPVSQGGDTQQLAEVGDFFFKRAGHPLAVDAVSSLAGADPNTVLLAKASTPGTDILWLFDRDVDGTAAAAYPPDIPRRDPRWTCKDFGVGDIGILACHRGRATIRYRGGAAIPVAVSPPTPKMAAARA